MKLNIAYEDDAQLYEIYFPDIIEYELLHENSAKTRSKAFKLKGKWSARLTPFVEVCDDKGNPKKLFYKEASKDPIKEAIDYCIDILKPHEQENINRS